MHYPLPTGSVNVNRCKLNYNTSELQIYSAESNIPYPPSKSIIRICFTWNIL